MISTSMYHFLCCNDIMIDRSAADEAAIVDLAVDVCTVHHYYST
jgi:nitric oxide reductase large subunit